MRLALIAALLWQLVHAAAGRPKAEPQYFRYQREIRVSARASGRTCAVLDAAVFAHASSEALSDMRLYAQPSNAEVPFDISVSGTQSDEEDAAVVENLGSANGDITFDALMPARPYSSVRLNVAAKDFVGTVKVSGVSTPHATPVALGTFTVFDLTAQHLARSTELPMQESTFPLLHFTLHVASASGASEVVFTPKVVTGVSVPQSREAETLYTTVALSSTFVTQGRDSVAEVMLRPHVAIDRVRIAPQGGFAGNFARQVTITATPNSGDAASAESVTGEISHVKLDGREASGYMTVDRSSFTVETPLVTNLKSSASLRIAVHNGDDRALPLAPAELQMRQRKVCFEADEKSTSFVLMYGDAAVAAPVYDYARLYPPSAVSSADTFGAEEVNGGYRPRADARPFTERHPGILWVVLLSVVALLGGLVLRGARAPRAS